MFLHIGLGDGEFKAQFAQVVRLHQHLVVRGGLPTAEAYSILVRRFPESLFDQVKTLSV